MKSDKTTFAQIEAFKSPPQGLKIIHPEQHPINKELLPLIEQCISELNTSKADTILVHSRSDSYLSFTVFYEKPIKKHYTLRLILSYSSDGKRSYKCSGF
ncbi:hypothetical protein THZG08_580016 [Vibrio owensii]|nr:hypothetical protein THZG08_580016 [Vibrio owensii]CAH1586501.1 hypothetical protein THOA03_580016 [Vibrio owensii]